MSISAIIFDLDDTLYDEIDYVCSGFKAVAEQFAVIYGLQADKIYDMMIGLFNEDRNDVFGRLVKQLSLDISVVAEMVNVYRAHEPHIHLRQDAAFILKYAKEAGYKIGLITDGDSRRQRAKLRALGIEDVFDAVIISGENPGGIGKPDAYVYRRCLSMLGVNPEEAVYVADNPAKDFIGAKALGIKTIRLINSRGLYKHDNIDKHMDADYIIHDLHQLADII